ncbi:MAG: hypothetical protein C4526_02910 [Nitrospiraceae bacterium]|nr:MAG: hypothetical protein C4526_02910 [Nitrospiraceae bacterium]
MDFARQGKVKKEVNTETPRHRGKTGEEFLTQHLFKVGVGLKPAPARVINQQPESGVKLFTV